VKCHPERSEGSVWLGGAKSFAPPVHTDSSLRSE